MQHTQHVFLPFGGVPCHCEGNLAEAETARNEAAQFGFVLKALGSTDARSKVLRNGVVKVDVAPSLEKTKSLFSPVLLVWTQVLPHLQLPKVYTTQCRHAK